MFINKFKNKAGLAYCLKYSCRCAKGFKIVFGWRDVSQEEKFPLMWTPKVNIYRGGQYKRVQHPTTQNLNCPDYFAKHPYL